MKYLLDVRLPIIYLIFSLWSVDLAAQTQVLDISIFDDVRPKAVVISPVMGSYQLIAQGNVILELNPGDQVELLVSRSGVIAKGPGNTLGTFDKLLLQRKKWGSVFRIKPISPLQEVRKYNDNLLISALNGRLKMVNNVFIEHYVAGVIEAEAGSKQIPEFYRVQAIICRTYALSNLRRHQKEGFHLCDQVHCQVYKGQSRFNPEIQKAVMNTRGIVLVDSDIRLITASFHSNCGGQTANSEDVWKYHETYLRSVPDTFCQTQPHASWHYKMPVDDWLSYLKRRYNYPVKDSIYLQNVLYYCPTGREQYLTDLDSNLALKKIRHDLKLRSAVFSVEHQEDSVNLYGNGFGHGVGLCQEGAMKMAESGIPYNEILHYYYKNVHLIDLTHLDFFRGE